MSPIAVALLIMAAMIVLFIWEPVPILVTAIGASIVYAYTGLIEIKDIFTGYNSNTIVLLAGMMIIGSSLFHSGITDLIGEKMVKVTGKSERNIIFVTLVVSCVLSAVCSNIGVMTAMAPLVTASPFWHCCSVHSSAASSLWSALAPTLLPTALWLIMALPRSASSASPRLVSVCASWVPCTSPSLAPR